MAARTAPATSRTSCTRPAVCSARQLRRTSRSTEENHSGTMSGAFARRVSRDEVVHVAQEIRGEEHHRGRHDQEDADPESPPSLIAEWVERERILRDFTSMPSGIVRSRDMQRRDMQEASPNQNERQQVVQARRSGSASDYRHGTRPRARSRHRSPHQGIAENKLVMTVAPQ